MTITRIGQLTAETRILSDVVFLPSGNLSIPDISNAQARTGSYSYRSNTAKAAMGIAVPPLSAYRLGFWMYMASTSFGFGGTGVALSGVSNTNSFGTGAYNFHIHINLTGGVLELRRPTINDSTYDLLESISIPSQLSTTGTWFHVGVTHKIHATEGFYSLYIDGNLQFSYLGDTRPSRNNALDNYLDSVTRVYATGGMNINSSWSNVFLDDLFVDSIDGEEDSPVPARRFLMVLPDGAGADADWTPEGGATNYENVDDNPHDGDTTYNKAVAADLRDTFTFSDITVPDDHRIVAVLPSPLVKRLDSEIDMQLSLHAWDGSQYGDSPDLVLPMSYGASVFHRFTTQPDGSDWTETDFNNMQFGYKSAGSFL